MENKSKNNESEARGPVLKTSSGWSINKLGLVVLLIIVAISLFLTYKAFSARVKNAQSNPGSDVTLPTGRIVSPKTGSVFNSNVLPIDVDAGDADSGVKTVEIFYKDRSGWQKLTTLDKAPYHYDWDISKLPVESVTLDIHVTDNANNTLTTNSEGWQEDIVIIPTAKGKIF